jgi:hypothetical protein
MVPSTAVRTALSELSVPLLALAQRNSRADSATACLAWSEGAAMWFVAGTTSLEMSRERGRPVLQLLIYGEDGALNEALNCVQTAANTWERCA